MSKQIVDGCTAATYVAYALSEVATIYPITPVASMGEIADKWNVAGRLNVFGAPMQVREMESELGAAGATHGALVAGALATTFTASQGLMLMLPNMFKIYGELLPAVFHVGCRTVASHALSIFGDHQDVMSCRTTGFTMLASSSVQETHDLAVVAHLAAIAGSLPVLHFFDGWRTSNEISTIDMLPYDSIASLVDRDAVARFRSRAMNPDRPDLRGSAQNPDVFFQNREAANRYYDAFPAIVQQYMDRLAALTGRQYHLFDYVGDPEATELIVAIGSSCDVIEETIGYLRAQGRRVGLIKVRLFRPFSEKDLVAAIPASVKSIAVIDRTKEPGAAGEPLYLDVAAALRRAGRNDIRLIGGRYGLASKDFDPSMVKAIYDELLKENPKDGFTVGITDDVTYRSLDVTDHIVTCPDNLRQAVFYGMGSDGTVGATKQAAAIIGSEPGLYAQAYFHYSAKKSGGYTISELRIGDAPIRSAYGIENADYVACNKNTYVTRFDLTKRLRPGGTFVLNSPWTAADMERELPASLRRDLASKKAKFYNIDAIAIAESVGLGVRINTIMLTVYFRLAGVVDFDKAVDALKELIKKTYIHEGGYVVDKNLKAVDAAAAAIKEIEVPASWADAKDEAQPAYKLPDFVAKIARPCLRLEGDSLPVSVFTPDGTMPAGTTAYEKRMIAVKVPEWDVDKCVECTECSLVCAHAAIRPYLLDAAEKAAASAGMTTKPTHGTALAGLDFRIQVFPRDCTGCGSCAVICPGHALTMQPIATQLAEQDTMLDYCLNHVTIKDGLVKRATINGSQFHTPMLEFSGACAGCGETPYVKLLTQLMGERMLIANATGCSSIWGANYPSNAYSTDRFGRGPAWGNSLFEDNAEYGFGMAAAVAHRRDYLASLAQKAVADKSTDSAVADALKAWLDARADAVLSAETGKKAVEALKNAQATVGAAEMIAMAGDFAKKSIWCIGGDGWAYDIGFAGLDHVLAQNVDINVLVMDTECYSNTGGQTSKATPLGAVAKYSADGKRTFKKDLGRMMMTYGTVYVASVALGANYQQTINALVEADAYDGPSIVIAYCPCINHGIRAGMGNSIVEERRAVSSGYWQLYRYNPSLAAAGQPALSVDAPKPDGSLGDFMDGEDRYADLKMLDPAEAAILRPEFETRIDDIYATLDYLKSAPKL